VVYAAYPTRATLVDALLAFRRYAPCRVFYLNLRVRRVPWYLRLVDFDLVVFQTLFFATRWDPAAFRARIERAAPLRRIGRLRVALPQDEFINADGVNDFLERLDVGAVFSVQPAHEWDTIYGARRSFAVHPVLTGYLDDERVAKLEGFQQLPRDIDIGYRTSDRPPAWLGRHGYLKADVARVVDPPARARGLVTDISVDAADTLLGDDWYRFLCRCRYTLGVEGGTSIIDRTGEIRRRTDAYAAEHPNATFEEIEAACFPGIDGTFRGFAISPRHLEACAARVCQVLTEGEYGGILAPGRHYIELKRDFSNLDEVLDRVQSGEGREEMTARAYDDIVGSKRYTYQAFVDVVLGPSATLIGARGTPHRAHSAAATAVYLWMRAVEHLDRVLTVLYRTVVVPFRRRRRRAVAR